MRSPDDALKLSTIDPHKDNQEFRSVDCYVNGGSLFDVVSLYCLKSYPFLVNKITHLQPCNEDEQQRTYALCDLCVKGKELHEIEKSIIKSIVEKSVRLESLDTKSLLTHAFFCYRYGNMHVLGDYFKEYEKRSDRPSDENNAWMGDLWNSRPDEVHGAFKQCTLENVEPLIKYLEEYRKADSDC